GDLDSDQIARALAARLARKVPLPSIAARLAALDARQNPAPARISLPVQPTANGVPNPQSAIRNPQLDIIPPPRTPYYCSGCPHNRSTQVPETTSALGAGIGCHSLMMLMDPERYGKTSGITQMGGEGAQWVGMAPFTEIPHLFQNIGDGTFFHSGALALNFAVASGANITYKLLYNSAVAMTGGQDAVGAVPIPALARRLADSGVKRTIITSDDPDRYATTALPDNTAVWHRDRLPEAHAALAAIPGVTVLLHDGQCATEKRRLRKRGKLVDPPTRVFINERVCEGCGDCGRKSNCLSVVPVETEFGRKTQIHPSSCNKDYSCLLGDCPSFVTVTPLGEQQPRKRTVAQPPEQLPEPTSLVDADGFALRMLGIGGTGVVTVNQTLGTAAVLAGLHVWALDQTGLAQKGGAVVSDLKLGRQPLDVTKVSAGNTDLYLGFDLLVANDAANLATADPARTVAVISTSKVATGAMVTDTRVAFPGASSLRARIDRATRREHNVYLDAQALSQALFGDHMQANFLLVGAAYQAGALPLPATAIEEAIRLNGVAVAVNTAAFRWGRAAVAEPAQADAVLRDAAASAAPPAAPPPSVEAQQLLDASGATGELRRLLEVRVPDLIAYQDAAYAARYAGFVKLVTEAEQRSVPGQTALAEAVARYLYKLMAYKDEDEVARLSLDPAVDAAIAAQFGPDVEVSWKLHPPVLRDRGLKQKIALGPWFKPGFQTLRAMKRLRGTRLDPFGHTVVRRV
ncbi:MAG: indolepyruvate ferredoxin oxidoreductase family protein, partial [Thermomicrobiales bacterium]